MSATSKNTAEHANEHNVQDELLFRVLIHLGGVFININILTSLISFKSQQLIRSDLIQHTPCRSCSEWEEMTPTMLGWLLFMIETF